MKRTHLAAGAALLLALLAAGCDTRPAQPGKIVMPPFGHLDLCAREPEHFACRP